MPLVTAAVLAFAAGSLAGSAENAMWPLAGLLMVVIAGATTTRDRLALAGLGLAGWVLAGTSRLEERRCADTLARSATWTARLEQDASPGAFARARTACGATVRIAVSDGRGAAGSLVDARGEVSQSQYGLMMTRATVRVVQPGSVAHRWRAAVGRGIDRIFGANAPLVRALLIADMRELTPAVRERFASAGLSHMLSVSGLHVGLIAAAVLLLAELLGVRRTRAEIGAAVLTAGYVLLIGAPLPAVRAALMLGALSLSRLTQRPTSPWALLAIGAGIPLVDPRAVTDVGYQLSVVGMVSLVSAGALARRWAWLAAGGWRGTLYRGITTSVLATVFTAPLVAATFGRVSLVAPLTNLAAVPVMAALQPMLFLAAVLLPFDAAARFVADACAPLIASIDRLAEFGASLPGAAIPVVADATSLALAGACIAALAIACVSRFPGRALVALGVGIATIAWRPLLPGTSGYTELHMLDVGQGDALALRTRAGQWVLFDAGRNWDGGDAGARVAVPYIAERGGRLHAFVLSHPHADHVGGATSAIVALSPRWYFDPGFAGTSPPYRASLEAARDRGVRWKRVRPGDSVTVDEAVITFLAPDSAWADSLADPNDASVVARIRVGRVTMLMTGDAERDEERWLLRNHADDLRADVLKVAHHGSETSSSDEFLDAVRPRLALVSVGADNRYGHPDAGVLAALAGHGAFILRTDQHGAVVVRTDGNVVDVESQGERWRLK